MTLLAASLVTLLLALAVLQYRWVGQLSDAERDRLRAGLHRRTQELAEEINRDLLRAHALGQLGPLPDDQDTAGRLAARYREWQRTARHPRLIRDIYIVGLDDRIVRFDPSRSALEAIGWTDVPAAVRAWAEKQRTVRVAAGRGTERVTVDPRSPVVDEIPALVVPGIRMESGPGELRIVRVVSVVIVIDAEYLRTELLPLLIERHLNPAGSKPEFLVKVIRRRDGSVIVESEEGPIDAATADARVSLIEVRAEQVGQLIVEQHRRSPGPRLPQNIETLRNPKSPSQPRNPQTLENSGNLNNLGNPLTVLNPETANPEVERPRPVRTLTFGLVTGGRMAAVAAGAPGGAWELLVTHRAGSIDRAIAGARARNLAISFGILTLFGASIILLVASAARARRLADQQMEFVAAVSHELRTPLAVIRSAAQNLADGVVRGSDQVVRYGRLIEEEGRHLTDTVEQVLAFAGIQGNPSSIERRPVDLGAVIDEVVRDAQRTGAEGFTFEVHRDDDLPLLEANREALRRILQNLIANAIKYSGESRWIGIGVRRRDEGAEVTVSDRGVGIDPGEDVRIFAPFYRGRYALASQIHGSGLGLSLVKRLVEAHGGRITVASERGRGSVFTVWLPIGDASRSADAAGGVEASPEIRSAAR